MYQAMLVPIGDSRKLCDRLFPPLFSLNRSVMLYPLYDEHHKLAGEESTP